jgi:aspartate/tyrosine/aromatic aminotransferase
VIAIETPLTEALFGDLDRQPADALLALIRLFARDLRSLKLELGPGLAPLEEQRGMFAMMRAKHGIGMARSDRINIAALTNSTISILAARLVPLLDEQALVEQA